MRRLLTGIVASVQENIGATPASIHVIVGLIWIAIGVTASYVPAARAARLDPSVAGSLACVGVRQHAQLATHIAVFVVLGAVGFLASYLPARRAATVDPMVVLRE